MAHSSGLLTFQYVDKDNVTIDDFPLIYDIEARNNDISWRLHTNRRYNVETYFVCSLRKEFLLSKDIHYRFPDIHDYSLAVSLALRQISMLRVPKSETNLNTFRNFFQEWALKGRFFSSFEMFDYDIRVGVCTGALLTYIENGEGRTPMEYDRNIEYTSCTLPLDAEEAAIYNDSARILDIMHIGAIEASNNNYMIHIGDTVTIMVRHYEALGTQYDLAECSHE